MARNKYPERTKEKILDVSFRLFAEKGYDKTSIQDIVNALGMSKGAIYHHFASKEEILEAIGERSFLSRQSDVITDPNMNGLEKLKVYIRNEFSNYEKQAIDRFAKNIIRIPQFTSMLLENTLTKNALMFEELMNEGIQDGSIQVTNPKLVSELFMLMSNIWVNPLLWDYRPEEFLARVTMIKDVLDHLGFPIIDQELMDSILQYYMQTTV